MIDTCDTVTLDNRVIEYWYDNYASGHCTICGNWGVIDSRAVTTPAGYRVGRLNFCICPNGQTLRAHGADINIILPDGRSNRKE